MGDFFKKTENIFVIFCLFWGILFLAINPPFQASDEPEHMYRMYGFVQGTLNFQELTIDGEKQTGLILPDSLLSIVRHESKMFFHPQEKTSFSETKMLSKIPLNPQIKRFKAFVLPPYTMVSYFPAFIVLWIMKILNVAPVSMMYILRFCTLLTYLTMIYFSIKITPVKKWLFFAAAAVPQSVYLGAAIKTDAIVIGLAFLATAYTLYLTYNTSIQRITTKQKIILGTFLTLLTICKFPYITMCLLPFIIPKEKFQSSLSKFLFILSIFLLNISIVFIIVFSHLILMKNISIINSVNNLPESQLIYAILQKPVPYIKFLSVNLISGWYYYIQGVFAHFGWGDVTVPPWVIYAYIILMTVCGFVNDKNEPEVKLSISQKFVFFLIFIIMTLITVLTCFIVASKSYGQGFAIYNDILFQGRYWIPLLPIFFMMANNYKSRFNLKWFKIATLNLFNFLMFVCTIIIVYRYYV